jgi:hypothetical protein
MLMIIPFVVIAPGWLDDVERGPSESLFSISASRRCLSEVCRRARFSCPHFASMSAGNGPSDWFSTISGHDQGLRTIAPGRALAALR